MNSLLQKRPPPWSVVFEAGKQKYNESTGEPVPVVDYYWVKDSNGNTVELFSGGFGQAKAQLLSLAPELLEVLKDASHKIKNFEGLEMEFAAAQDLAALLRRIEAVITKVEANPNV